MHLECPAVPAVLHDVQAAHQPEAHREHHHAADDAHRAVLLVLEVRREHEDHSERGGAGEVQEANHEALDHELRARLRVEELDLTGLRVRVVPAADKGTAITRC
jgi:hypothetical protein